MKKYLVFLITLLILSTSIINATNGVETIPTKYAYDVEKNGSNLCCKTFSIITYNGEIAYCLQPFVKVSDTANYLSTHLKAYNKVDPLTQDKIELVVKYGYDYPGHDTVQYYMAAQKLIWGYLGYTTTYFQNNSYDKKYSVAKYTNEINRLIENDSLFPSLEKEYQLKTDEELIIEDTNNVLSDFSLAYSDNLEANITDNKLSIKLLDYNPATLTLTRGKPNSSSETLEVITNSNAQNLVISPSEGYKADGLPINIIPSDLGSLCIVKKDEETKEIITKKGISFQLLKKDDSLFVDKEGKSTFTTDKSGTITIVDIPFGKYYLKEIETCNGYLLNKKKVEVVIDSKELKTLDFYNKPIKGQLTVHKTQQDDKNIDVPLARYQLIDEKGIVHGDDYTDENGEIIFSNLQLGTYTLEEVEAPKGYQLDNEVHQVVLNAKDNDKPIIYSNVEVNDPKTPLICTVTKNLEESLFIDPKEALKQTAVGLYNDQAQLLGEYYFSNGDTLEITLPSPGHYFIQETNAHPNYFFNLQQFEIDASEDTVTPSLITIDNLLLRYSFKVTKKDSQSKKPLKDATFTIYSDSSLTKKVAKATTNNKGHLIFENLELGTYYLKETTAPANYSLNHDSSKIEVTDDDDINTITILDNKIVDTSTTIKPYYLLGLLVVPLVIIIKVIMQTTRI